MIALIGAGPLGIELAVALSRAGLPYTHFEAGQIGATMAWWAPGTRWFSSNERISIAGVPLVTPQQEKATREEYLAYLRSVVLQFNLSIRTFTRVTAVERTGPQFRLRFRHALLDTVPEETLLADKIILATGGTASANQLNIPGEDLPHVSHYFHDPHLYFQKKLLIVGGRNSAVEAALRCHRAGAKVYFSYRGAQVDKESIKYWLYPEFSALLKTGEISGHFGTMAVAISASHVTLAPVPVRASPMPATRHELPAEFVLLLTGYRADMSLASSAGVNLADGNEMPTFNPETMETNIPGLYVAGTATAGTQGRPRGYKTFLENCHVHVPRIIHHLMGEAPPGPAAAPSFERPES